MAGVAVADRYHAGTAALAVEVFLSDWERSRPTVDVGKVGHAPRPYSFDALDRAVGVDWDGAPLPTVVVAAKLQVPGRQVLRWRASGTLTEHQADVLATRLGVHPASVWPNWLDGAGEPSDGA